MTTTALDTGLHVVHGADALAAHLLLATQAAAIACARWVGRDDPKGADAAAVAAMREALASMPGSGTIVIGEGEKDNAPMLFNGESVGTGGDPAIDIAVDPLENTTACARALDGAMAVIAAAPGGTLWGSSSAWYMDKLVVGPAAAGHVDITRPVADNLRAVGAALGRAVADLTVIVLDKPRHVDLTSQIRAAGATVRLIPAGDVAGSLAVLLPDAEGDLLMGVGGAPEGVISACAVRQMGGDMQARLAPQSDEERARVRDAGHDVDLPMLLDDLVASNDCCFVATSVTMSAPLRVLRAEGTGWRSCSFVSTPLHPHLVVEAVHREEGNHA